MEKSKKLLEKYGEMSLSDAKETIKEAGFTKQQQEAVLYLVDVLNVELEFLMQEIKENAEQVEKDLRQLLRQHKHFQNGKSGLEL